MGIVSWWDIRLATSLSLAGKTIMLYIRLSAISLALHSSISDNAYRSNIALLLSGLPFTLHAFGPRAITLSIHGSTHGPAGLSVLATERDTEAK